MKWCRNGKNDLIKPSCEDGSASTSASDVVDFKSTMERFGGDHELMKQAANMFLDTYPSLVCKVRSAFIKRDADLLELKPHVEGFHL